MATVSVSCPSPATARGSSWRGSTSRSSSTSPRTSSGRSSRPCCRGKSEAGSEDHRRRIPRPGPRRAAGSEADRGAGPRGALRALERPHRKRARPGPLRGQRRGGAGGPGPRRARRPGRGRRAPRREDPGGERGQAGRAAAPDPEAHSSYWPFPDRRRGPLRPRLCRPAVQLRRLRGASRIRGSSAGPRWRGRRRALLAPRLSPRGRAADASGRAEVWGERDQLLPAGTTVESGSMKKEKLNDAQRQMLAALEKLREFQPTPEEERVMDEFEEFQRQHPINFSSLEITEEDDDEQEQAAIRAVALKTAARRLKDDD